MFPLGGSPLSRAGTLSAVKAGLCLGEPGAGIPLSISCGSQCYLGANGPLDLTDTSVSWYTAEVRYLVLPERPAGAELLTEDALAALVTRDSMVGVAKAITPGQGGKQ
jgi:hypothetical protein